MSFEFPRDLSLFEEVPGPQAHSDIYRLSLSKGDQLSQNNAFHKRLNGSAAFCLRISPDGRMLALGTEGPANLTFSAAGVRTHHPLADMVRQRGLELPLSYRMFWSDDLNCWIGQYDGLCPPPAAAKQAGKAPRRRKEA